MCIETPAVSTIRQRGLTLVELVLFIVIVSVAVAGVLLVMNVTTRYSADPLPRKQALAIAEALLEEVRLMPFTECDPDALDPSGATACASLELMGPEPGEVRGALDAPFDNVNDYHGFQLQGGAGDVGGTGGVTVPAGYSAAVAISQDAGFGAPVAPIPATDSLRITVTVNFGNDSLALETYRTRYMLDADL